MTVYSKPSLITGPDVYSALIDFVAQYAQPAMPATHILRGWQNRGHLPQHSNDYAVITLISQVRHGTNIKQYTQPKKVDVNGSLTELTLREALAQIDFIADGSASMSRAESIHTVARGSMGAAFFADYGIGCNFCDDIRAVEFVDSSMQYVNRAIVTLHISYWSGIKADLPFFNAVDVNFININLIPED